MSALFNILEKRLAERDESTPLADLRAQVRNCPSTRTFVSSLRTPQRLAVIAEMKFRSPSQGEIRRDRDVERIAQSYSARGAAALSIVTETNYFDGSLDYLRRARASCALPLLRKDFLWDERDLLEARLFGADAVLLIAKMLDHGRLLDLRFLAHELSLDVLLELHDEADLKIARDVSGVALGVNHRNLNSLQIDMDASARLFPLLPPQEVKVAESGISSREQFAEMKRRGANAVLIGTSLMKSEDPGLALRELLS